MALQADNVLDLVTTTLRDLGELKWTNIMSSLQEHVAMNRLIRKHKVGFHSGYGIQFNVAVNQNNAAKMTGLYGVDVYNAVDGMKTANLPWRHSTTSYVIDEREIKMNREPRRIVDMLKFNRAQGMTSLAELMETQFWSPPSSSSDTLNSFGVPYWIVPSTTQGFNGGNPFGFSSGAGSLDSATYVNWANYTDSYTDVSKFDLVRALRRAMTFTKFETPTIVSDAPYAMANEYGLYTTYFVRQRLEELAEQQNDNLGNDVASKDGLVLFRKRPLIWVPKFESLMSSTAFSNSTYTSSGGYPKNPVYGICWNLWRPVFLEGEYLLEFGPIRAPNQHKVFVTFVDTTFNFECRDRRRQFVVTQ